MTICLSLSFDVIIERLAELPVDDATSLPWRRSWADLECLIGPLGVDFPILAWSICWRSRAERFIVIEPYNGKIIVAVYGLNH